jgi:hypothetical protein
MHQWIVYGHILGALLFMLAHGTSAAVVFRLRRERDPNAVRVLLGLSKAVTPVAYVALLLLVGAGLWAGFDIPGLARGWFWMALVLLVGIMIAMYAFITPVFGRVRGIVGDGSQPVDAAALDTVLAEPRPMIGAGIGLLGILVILWLMVLKPF